MVKRKRTNNDLKNITQKDGQYNGQKTKNKKDKSMVDKTLH